MLAPESPPNYVIQMAVKCYNSQGLNWPGGAPDQKEVETEHPPKPFKKGQKVRWMSSDADIVEGEVGAVVGGLSNGRIRVQFGKGIWAFAPHELTHPDGRPIVKPSASVSGMPEVHPDAKEIPISQHEIVLQRQRGEKLGLVLNHEPPPEEQKEGRESVLIVEKVMPEGYGHKHNTLQKDSSTKLQPGDRIVAVLDGSKSPEERRPVRGNSQAMFEVITRNNNGVTPLVFFVVRILGPPLRFKVGQRVEANCGDDGWQTGMVVKVWDEDRFGNPKPYAVRLDDSSNAVMAPRDSNDCVRKAKPRFSKGQQVMVNRGEPGYRKATIVSIGDEPTRTSYKAKMMDGSGEVDVPEDLNQFIRAPARFKKGDHVLARVSGDYLPGIVEEVYNPRWVYAIKLKNKDGHVIAPEDSDVFVKKR